MPTTFDVISLGVFSSIDPTEGNSNSESASVLVGETIGGPGNPLFGNIQSLSPGSTGFAGGATDRYDSDQNVSSDTFSIDGGPDQIVDGTAVYSATLTYTDGTTANISAVIFQDTSGNTYLAPETDENSDQAVLEAKPIASITIDSLLGSNTSLVADRSFTNFVTCFAQGTLIATPNGDTPVELLRAGDLVTTRDEGVQPILWIGTRHLNQEDLEANPGHRPISIAPGTIGNWADLTLSGQHKVMVNWQGTERLISAKHLKQIVRGKARICRGTNSVSYTHVLLPSHGILCANGAPCESFFPGPVAMSNFDHATRQEIAKLIPLYAVLGVSAYGGLARPAVSGAEIRKRQKCERRSPAGGFLTR